MEQNDTWWGGSFVRNYQNAPTPVFLVNRDCTFAWANEALNGLFPGQQVEEGVNRLLFLRRFSTVFDQLRQNPFVLLTDESLLGGNYDCHITPVFEGDALCGCAVTLRAVRQSGALTPEGMERVLATFTHQTRGPLSTIFSALSGILRCNEELADPEIHEYAGKISAQSYRLLRTSANITQMQRYEHQLSTAVLKKQDLGLFFEYLCRIVSIHIEKIGIRFRYSVPGEPVVVRFDPDRLGELLLNLISNSAKFIGENGEILVTLGVEETRAAITVADNGLGVGEEFLPRVFEPFYSRDPRTEGICGDGLGLSLCRLIAQEHGGTIELRSREGKGCSALVLLPLCGEDDPAKLTVSDVPYQYANNRFSNLYVILSDVCPVRNI